MDAVSYLMAATLLQASGSLLQKQRVSQRRPDVDWVEATRGPGRFLGGLVRDPLWVASYLLVIPGAFLGLQALSMMDITMVKSLGRLETVFVVLGGAWLLGERMNRREGLGIALTLIGGAVLIPGVSDVSGVSPGLAVHLVYLAGCVSVLALLLGASRAYPGKVSPELAIGLSAGLILGAGDLLVKAATEVVQARTAGFHIASLESHAVLWTTPELWLCLLCMLSGLFLYQVGFSTGRVAVLMPTGAITATLPPMVFGVFARAETIDGERLPGIALLILGGLLLSWPSAEGAIPPTSQEIAEAA